MMKIAVLVFILSYSRSWAVESGHSQINVLPNDVMQEIITAGSLTDAIEMVKKIGQTNKAWRNFLHSEHGVAHVIKLLSNKYHKDQFLIAALLHTKHSLEWIEKNKFSDEKIAQSLYELFAMNDGNYIYDKAITSIIKKYNFSQVISLFIDKIVAKAQDYKSEIDTLKNLQRRKHQRRPSGPEEIRGLIEQADGTYVVLIQKSGFGFITLFLKRFNKDRSEDSSFGSKGVITLNKPLDQRDNE